MKNHPMIGDLKTELRAMMNGVASAAMRSAGMTADYRVNYGVELPRLQELASEYATLPLEDVVALWHENVRECRILALMLYPAGQMDAEMADVWAADIRTTELAQIASLHLFSRMPHATDKALQWIAGDSDLLQILGFYTFAHILRHTSLNDRATDELRDQAEAALQSPNRQLQLAAYRLLSKLESEEA